MNCRVRRSSPALLLPIALLTLAACRSSSRTAPAASRLDAPTIGISASYRGDWEAPHEASRRFRLQLARSDAGLIVVEVRGFTGPAAVVGAVRGGLARVVLVQEHRVEDGRDDERFWQRVLGVPVSGALFESLASAPRGEELAAIAGWRVSSLSRDDDSALPLRIVLERDGARLTLERLAIGALRQEPLWPPVPRGFIRSEDHGAVSPQERPDVEPADPPRQ